MGVGSRFPSGAARGRRTASIRQLHTGRNRLAIVQDPSGGTMSTVANRITIKRLHPLFVGEVTGIDCSAPMSREDFRTIWEAFNEHQILVFRDQHFDDESQIAFSSKFNELET